MSRYRNVECDRRSSTRACGASLEPARVAWPNEIATTVEPVEGTRGLLRDGEGIPRYRLELDDNLMAYKSELQGRDVVVPARAAERPPLNGYPQSVFSRRVFYPSPLHGGF